jgi:hypothetical protein
MQTILQCLLVLLLVSHWYACIIALQATLHTSVAHTWLARYAVCNPTVEVTNGALLDACDGLDMGLWYLSSFAWAAMIMTGTGGTDMYPKDSTVAELIILTCLVIVGAFIWTQASSSAFAVHFRVPQ